MSLKYSKEESESWKLNAECVQNRDLMHTLQRIHRVARGMPEQEMILIAEIAKAAIHRWGEVPQRMEYEKEDQL